jgi:hypothetical protein
MNNTLNNNSSKTSKARQICTFSNLYDPIINVGYKGVYPSANALDSLSNRVYFFFKGTGNVYGFLSSGKNHLCISKNHSSKKEGTKSPKNPWNPSPTPIAPLNSISLYLILSK